MINQRGKSASSVDINASNVKLTFLVGEGGGAAGAGMDEIGKGRPYSAPTTSKPDKRRGRTKTPHFGGILQEGDEKGDGTIGGWKGVTC